MVETLVDKVNFEEKNGELHATSVTLMDKTGATRDVKVRKEVIVSGGDCARVEICSFSDTSRCLLLAADPASIRNWSEGRIAEIGHQMLGGLSRRGKESA